MLTKRLNACMELVTIGGVACDVGTDHAYLATALLQTGRCEGVIASDIGEGPLRAAKRTVQQSGLQDRIQLVLSDGLQQISPEGITDVIIAGMGAETIIHILEDCPWIRSTDRNLILQPMTKAPILRQWLAQQGFDILQERIVQEEPHYYVVMQVQWSGAVRTLSLLEEQVGLIDWKDPAVIQYAKIKQLRSAAIARQMQIAGNAGYSYYQTLADAIKARLLQVEKGIDFI